MRLQFKDRVQEIGRRHAVVGSAAQAVQRPAMILYGKRGPTIAGEERFKTAAPQIPIQVLEGSGHFPMLDEPAAFAEILIDFCGKHAFK
jgi:pimeloyl-ACP methyl ester carboxylesterase